jgi:hypothetical protein
MQSSLTQAYIPQYDKYLSSGGDYVEKYRAFNCGGNQSTAYQHF